MFYIQIAWDQAPEENLRAKRAESQLPGANIQMKLSQNNNEML